MHRSHVFLKRRGGVMAERSPRIRKVGCSKSQLQVVKTGIVTSNILVGMWCCSVMHVMSTFLKMMSTCQMLFRLGKIYQLDSSVSKLKSFLF